MRYSMIPITYKFKPSKSGGTYVWYTGQHVLLNCPKCWEYDLDKMWKNAHNFSILVF